jgi:hypothetical protein
MDRRLRDAFVAFDLPLLPTRPAPRIAASIDNDLDG